jgi:eukaryotic-like serine/threonine-protein kinase
MITGTRTGLDTPFLRAVLKSGLLTADSLAAALAMYDPEQVAAADPIHVATFLVRKKMLTKFQAMQLLSGKTQGFVLGKYTITSGLRQDRVGMVFRAEHADTKEEVAIVVLPTDRVADKTMFQPFLKEARRAAQVNSPAVARVFEVGEWCGTHYVVSELVQAPTLDKVVAKEGPLTPNAAAQVIAQVAVALMSGHAEGLLHRDIKPANIALLPDNRVKVLDLGLTHMIDNPWANVTKRINLKEYAEEVAYIAPEQAWGSELDSRSDIYSLGCTAYFLLTGQVPFPGPANESMTARQLHDVPKPSDLNPEIPAELDEIVQQMGAKDPHRRFQSAEELVATMLPWLPVEDWTRLRVERVGTAPAREQKSQAARPVARSGLRGWLRSTFRRLFGG